MGKNNYSPNGDLNGDLPKMESKKTLNKHIREEVNKKSQ